MDLTLASSPGCHERNVQLKPMLLCVHTHSRSHSLTHSLTHSHLYSLPDVFAAGILQHPDGTVLKQLQPPPRGPREMQFYTKVMATTGHNPNPNTHTHSGDGG